eukprot:486550-Prymnesium_polylepis.1
MLSSVLLAARAAPRSPSRSCTSSGASTRSPSFMACAPQTSSTSCTTPGDRTQGRTAVFYTVVCPFESGV